MDTNTNIGTAFALTFGAVGVHWIPSLLGFHSREASLKATNAELEKRLSQHTSDANKRDEESQAKILELQTKYDARFSREAILSKYPVDITTGTCVLDDIHYCCSCLNLEIQKRIPMLRKDGSYKCPSCNAYYPSSQSSGMPVGILPRI